MNTFPEAFYFFIKVTAELLLLFMAITTLVEVLLMYLPPHRIRRILAGKKGSKITGNIMGATLGAMTPFCACSTIPLLSGMLRAQAPFGAVMSFLIASPLLNPMIIGMLAAFLGWKPALLYLGIGFGNAVLFGWILEKYNAESLVKKVRQAIGCCNAAPTRVIIPGSITGKFRQAFLNAWKSLRAVMAYLLAGVALGAGIYGYLPHEFVLEVAGPNNPLAVPVAAVIGVPLYIRVEAAIAIGVAMMEKGMSVGAVVALVIGGAGMAIPEMSLLAGIFRKRLVALVIAMVFMTAVSGGFIFNLLFQN